MTGAASPPSDPQPNPQPSPQARRAPHVLAVDLGTSGVKVAVMGFDGSLAAWQVEPVRLILVPGGGVEQVPSEWWSALVTAVFRLHRDHPDLMRSVVTVCCSTQGEGTIPVDERGEPLANCLTWLDSRGAGHLRDEFGSVVAVRGLSVTRLARWIRYTGGAPSTTGKDPAAHMLFVRDTMPEVYARTSRFLNVLDYLNLRLTGQFVATWDSITTSWVTDNRDPCNVVYERSLVRASGIDADKLPDLVPSTTVLGRLSASAARDLGLTANVTVVAGAIDTSAGAVGSGAVGDRDVHLNLGTSSWLAAHVAKKKTDLRHSIAAVPSAVPGRYLATALQSAAGVNLQLLAKNYLNPDDALHQDVEPTNIPEILDELASGSPPGSRGVMYTPWIYGERVPVEDRTARAAFLNLGPANTRSDAVRSVFEGVAYNTRWMAGPFADFLGEPPSSINVIGGGALSPVQCQILADVLGVAIRQVEHPRAANARGAALIAAVGVGAIGFGDIPALVKVPRVYEPTASRREVYDEGFATFTQVYERLAPVYQRLHGGRPARSRRLG